MGPDKEDVCQVIATTTALADTERMFMIAFMTVLGFAVPFDYMESASAAAFFAGAWALIIGTRAFLLLSPRPALHDRKPGESAFRMIFGSIIDTGKDIYRKYPSMGKLLVITSFTAATMHNLIALVTTYLVNRLDMGGLAIIATFGAALSLERCS